MISIVYIDCLVYFQLDALQLDKDILRIVREQLISAAQNLTVISSQRKI